MSPKEDRKTYEQVEQTLEERRNPISEERGRYDPLGSEFDGMRRDVPGFEQAFTAVNKLGETLKQRSIAAEEKTQATETMANGVYNLCKIRRELDQQFAAATPNPSRVTELQRHRTDATTYAASAAEKLWELRESDNDHTALGEVIARLAEWDIGEDEATKCMDLLTTIRPGEEVEIGDEGEDVADVEGEECGSQGSGRTWRTVSD